MKRMIAAICAAMMLCGLAGCGVGGGRPRKHPAE